MVKEGDACTMTDVAYTGEEAAENMFVCAAIAATSFKGESVVAEQDLRSEPERHFFSSRCKRARAVSDDAVIAVGQTTSSFACAFFFLLESSQEMMK